MNNITILGLSLMFHFKIIQILTIHGPSPCPRRNTLKDHLTQSSPMTIYSTHLLIHSPQVHKKYDHLPSQTEIDKS